jgi:hypothetical protein
MSFVRRLHLVRGESRLEGTNLDDSGSKGLHAIPEHAFGRVPSLPGNGDEDVVVHVPTKAHHRRLSLGRAGEEGGKSTQQAFTLPNRTRTHGHSSVCLLPTLRMTERVATTLVRVRPTPDSWRT